MMHRRIRTAAALAFTVVLAAAGVSQPRPGESPAAVRERAQQLYADGNYLEAYGLYERLATDPETEPLFVGGDFDMAVNCLGSLNRQSETDDLRERAASLHAGNWRLLWRVAESWFSADHYGYIVAGEFHRGHHRGGGRYVSSFERDRAHALQLMEEARLQTAGEAVKGALSEFHLRYAWMILGYRGYQGAWRLQYLTDMATLPDYGEGYDTPWGGDVRTAPVHPDGAFV